MFYDVLCIPKNRCEASIADITVAKHVLLQHQRKVINGEDEEDCQRLHVRQNSLINDTLAAFSRSGFDVSKMLKVVFIPEGAVDDGGPRREFFQRGAKEWFLFYWLDQQCCLPAQYTGCCRRHLLHDRQAHCNMPCARWTATSVLFLHCCRFSCV